MRIPPYQQTTPLSCLPACLLMGLQIKTGFSFYPEDEQQLLFNGLLFNREIYHIGILEEFSKRFKKTLKVWVDNKYFSESLKKLPISNDLKIHFHKIDLDLILGNLSNKRLMILYLDLFYLRNNLHSPHFVVVEKLIKDRLVVLDPWKGKRFYLKSKVLMKAIDSLRNHLGFCPILVEIE